MSARKRAKELFEEAKIENTPMNWHIWKRAFDAGFIFTNRSTVLSEEDAEIYFAGSNIENTRINYNLWKQAFIAGSKFANRPIIMSEEDAKIFSDALENPAEPTEALKKAMKSYNKHFKPKK